MNARLWAATIACGVLFAGLAAGSASAQATRTWVSGVGDDVNPCSRTAPCKTFAGAISKTAAGGEINCLDPGGFGTVTITKALSIVCDTTEGGVAASSTNGITVNAGTMDIVYLSGLDLEGFNTGLIGVNVLQAAAVHIHNSKIRGFNSAGVKFAPNQVSELYLVNTTVADNAGGSVLAAPGTNGSGYVAMRNVSLLNSASFGFKLDVSGASTGVMSAAIQDSTIAGNNSGGIVANSTTTGSTAKALIQVTHSVVIGNQQGIFSAGSADSAIFFAESTVTANVTGFVQSGGGILTSYKNNFVDGNGTLGTFGQTSPQ